MPPVWYGQQIERQKLMPVRTQSSAACARDGDPRHVVIARAIFLAGGLNSQVSGSGVTSVHDRRLATNANRHWSVRSPAGVARSQGKPLNALDQSEDYRSAKRVARRGHGLGERGMPWKRALGAERNVAIE
jgi:hypothetical protein